MMATARTRRIARCRRSGIALVIVLGLMAMLVILAVGFFVAMRTERLVARSYADQVRAREMAYLAINRAVTEIDDEINNAGRVIPNWPAEVKFTQAGIVLTNNNSKPLFDLSTNDYAFMSFPSVLRPSLTALVGAVCWNDVAPDFGGGTVLQGRYAYMAANVSGFIDPNMDYTTNNVIADFFTRTNAFNAMNIAYNSAGITNFLTELNNPYSGAGNPQGINLFVGRTVKSTAANVPGRIRPYYRAETVPDLRIMGMYGYNVIPLKDHPANMFPYSYFPLGFRDAGGNAQTNIYIGGSATNVSAQIAQIAAAFQSMPVPGLNATDPDGLARGLVDYLDSDFVPGGIDGGGTTTGANCDRVCNEAVPMLHQLHINTNISSSTGGVYRAGVQIIAQVWYPFVYPTNSLAHSVRMEVSVDGNGYTADGATSATLSIPTPANGWIAHSFATCTNTFWFQTSGTNAIPVSLTLKELSVLQGTKVVDRACGPGSPSNSVIPWTTYFADSTGTTVGSWWFAPDPRCNWVFVASGNNQWRNGGTKGGGMPNWAGSHPSIAGEYGRKEMYVRNAGNLQNVGELGMLAYEGTAARGVGEWRTVRLLGPDALPVVDVFTVHTNALTGIVNPNTINWRPIGAMFLGASIDRWPGETNAVVNAITAETLGKAVVIGNNALGNPYNNRGDLARMDLSALALTYDGAQLEGIYRNTQAFLSPRQNLFLIVVAGQSVTDSNPKDNFADETAGEIRGDARAVALVWRDPYKVNGKNKIFIRWIKWLDQ